MIFVIITSTIGGLQIFAEPRLFDDTIARNGGSDRQFGTLTMLIYDFGWRLRDLGRASATAWLLFLLIVVFALVNFLVSRRLGAWGAADEPPARLPRLRPAGRVRARLGRAALLVVPDRVAHRRDPAQGTPPLLPGRALLRERPAGLRHGPVLEGAGQQPPRLRR